MQHMSLNVYNFCELDALLLFLRREYIFHKKANIFRVHIKIGESNYQGH